MFQMTTDKRGNPVCILVRRAHFTRNDTWGNFTEIPIKSPGDQDMVEWLKRDGLKLGDWVTIPDPFEDEWPFARRYPGSRCPPDPKIKP